tara:strand:+ start:211 stop:666 length:456 start_codon:yes stop_codon:yes gene_type:complete
MIRLDWDNCSFKKMVLRVETMKKSNYPQSIEIRASPSLDGFHAIISTFGRVPEGIQFFLRSEWWDDPIRLKNDMLLYSKARDVLFQKKIYKNIEFHEISMFLYYRETLRSTWKKKILSKNQTILNEFCSEVDEKPKRKLNETAPNGNKIDL